MSYDIYKSGMPEFSIAFSGNKSDRKLTHQELVRAIRFMIAAEYEAIQLYEQLAESTDNTLAQKVLIEISHEEKEHAGEFQRLLRELAPGDESFYKEGMEETEEKIEKMKPKVIPSKPAKASAKTPGKPKTKPQKK